MEGNGTPRVSIITVCYNAEDGIESTLRSVTSLGFRDFEHVIIDGGSKDGTLEILRRYEGHRIVLVSEPDAGIYDAMNKGMRLAKGDFVWFLNAKDTIHDGSFLDVLDWTHDFYYGGVVLKDGDKVVKKLMPSQRLTSSSSIFGQVACHQSMLVRKSLAPAYDLRYRLVSDFDWSIRILKTPDIRSRLVPSHWINYELDGVSSRNAIACWKENIDILSRNYGSLARPMAYLMYARFRAKKFLKERIVSRFKHDSQP